jgi:hypothetical protein
MKKIAIACVVFAVAGIVSAGVAISDKAAISGKSSISTISPVVGLPNVLATLVVGQSLGWGYGSGGYSAFGENTASVFTNNWMPFSIDYLGISGADQPHTRRQRDRIAEAYNFVTGWKAYADHLASLCASNSVPYNGSLTFTYAQSGAPYSEQCKTSTVTSTINGTTTNEYGFAVRESTNQINYQSSLSVTGLQFVILCVHGEGDSTSATYGQNLLQWQADYTADIGAMIGQSSIPFFTSQPASFGSSLAGTEWRAATNMLWAHEVGGGQSNILVMPKYFLNPYSDGTHLTNSSYDWMAEYYAKAVFKKVVQGQNFDPLYPTNISRVGATITLSYTGGTWPLVLDTVSVSDPGNYGFNYTNSSGTLRTISSVSVVGNNQIEIALSGTPTGTETLAYAAWNGNSASGHGGPTTGPRGCVRDSDPALGFTTRSNLWNWGVVFVKGVP